MCQVHTSIIILAAIKPWDLLIELRHSHTMSTRCNYLKNSWNQLELTKLTSFPGGCDVVKYLSLRLSD